MRIDPKISYKMANIAGLPSNRRPTIHSRMRAFSYAWSLPVTWQRWRSHHSICHIRKPHATRKLVDLWFIELELRPLEVLHCGNTDFRPFLLLWPWPWPDDLHMWTSPVVPGDIRDVQYELPASRLSKGLVWLTDRQTCRQ